jgi:hypothetical protein
VITGKNSSPASAQASPSPATDPIRVDCPETVFTAVVHSGVHIPPLLPSPDKGPDFISAMRQWGALIAAVLICPAAYLIPRESDSDRPDSVPVVRESAAAPRVAEVTKASLAVCCTEDGIWEVGEVPTVANPVKGLPVALASMLPYGSAVTKGQVIAKLDLSGLNPVLADQQSKLLAARMKVREAEEAIEVLKSKHEGELAASELQAELAQIDLDRYAEDEKKVELTERRGQIAMAERDLLDAEESSPTTERSTSGASSAANSSRPRRPSSSGCGSRWRRANRG